MWEERGHIIMQGRAWSKGAWYRETLMQEGEGSKDKGREFQETDWAGKGLRPTRESVVRQRTWRVEGRRH